MPDLEQWGSEVGAARVQEFQTGPPHSPRMVQLGPPLRWARVHCTPCTPYCCSTGFESLWDPGTRTLTNPRRRTLIGDGPVWNDRTVWPLWSCVGTYWNAGGHVYRV